MIFFRVNRDPDPSTAPGSASTTLPLPPVTPPAGTPPAVGNTPPAPSAFAIPDAYKDKPYLKGVDSMDKVYSMLDGAQSLIGKRTVPAADAPPEEWNKFYEAMRPKEATEYKFDGADKADPLFVPKLQAAFHKNGLTATQAKGVYADVSQAIGEILKEKGIADEKQNTDFDALGSKVFGAQRDQVLATAKNLISANAHPEMKEHIGKLSNEALIILASVLDNVNKKYIKQDGPPAGQPNATGMTPADISAKARALMMTPEYTNVFHSNHDAVKKQIDELYSALRSK